MDLALDAFNMDIFEAASIYDPYTYFGESMNEEGFVLTEAGKVKVNKGNILKRLLELLKKALTWIKNAFAKIVNFFKRLFGKKKVTKTADQCAAETFGKPNGGKSGVAPGKSEVIKLPIDEHNSQANPPSQIEVMNKELEVAFTGKEGEMAFTVGQIESNIKEPKTVQGHALLMWTIPVASLLVLIKDKSLSQRFLDVIKNLASIFELTDVDKIKSKSKELEDATISFDNDLGEKSKAAVRNKNNPITITLNEINEFQKEFNIAQEGLINIDHSKKFEFDKYYDVVELLNVIMTGITSIQFSLNAISGSFKHIFSVGLKYKGVCDDVEAFAKFAKNMIDAGIPPKYISYNCYIVASDKIHDNSNFNERKPCWGMTRVVFFPKDKSVVYKIALSAYGKLSNKMEYDICKKSIKIYGAGKKNSLPIVIINDLKADGVLSVAERVDIVPNEFNTNKKEEEFMNSLHEFYKKTGSPNFDSDIFFPYHNCGYRKKSRTVVSIDYALNRREATA